MADEVTVKVLLNTAHEMGHAEGFRMFTEGYRAGDPLYQALVFRIGFPACGKVDHLLQAVWNQLNVQDPVMDWAQQYRAAPNRSLSLGDVVVIGEQAFAVRPVGWEPVTVTAEQIWYDLGRMAE